LLAHQRSEAIGTPAEIHRLSVSDALTPHFAPSLDG
jgi:hypothetical protein